MVLMQGYEAEFFHENGISKKKFTIRSQTCLIFAQLRHKHQLLPFSKGELMRTL